jgi:hypothetical protein
MMPLQVPTRIPQGADTMLTRHALEAGRRARVGRIALALVITTCVFAGTPYAGGEALPPPATISWGLIAGLAALAIGGMSLIVMFVRKRDSAFKSSNVAPRETPVSKEGSAARSSDAAPRETPISKVLSSASVPTPLPNSIRQEGRIFVSYRREDSGDVAGRIYDRLVDRFGKHQVFKDVDSIPLGVDFRKHLQEKVGSCDVMLAIIGHDWLRASGSGTQRRLDDAKDFVRIELEAAIQRDIPVIPVLVRGADVPKESDLPSTLGGIAYRNGIAVRPDPDFHRDMDRLIEGVEGHLTTKT